jgi:DNA-binding Lrp family transcriptional regulator
VFVTYHCQNALMARQKRPRALDEVSKLIIEQLQRDGRRSYADIGKVVGLSEAAVRQRVQKLTEQGVLQIVAVTETFTYLELRKQHYNWGTP